MLVTGANPKAALSTLQGRTVAADDDAVEVEESQSSSGSEAEEEVYSEAEASAVDDKPQRVKAEAPNKGRLFSGSLFGKI